MVQTTNQTNRKILITGAKGQLGSEIKALANLYDEFTFVFTDVDDLDITDPLALKEFCNKYKPNFIVNCAAYTAVDRAEDEETLAQKLNAEAPKHLAEAARGVGAKLIHISTDYVFNGRTWEPYSEQDQTSPNSAYGLSKLKGEEFALGYDNTMVIRTSWLYSNYGNNFVKTIARKGKTSDSLRVVFDQVGTPTWGHDLAKAIVEIIIKSENSFVPGIFHYSNEGVCSWYDFALEIVSYLNINCKVVPVLSCEYQTKANRPPYSVLNKAKIKNTFGISVPHWKDSLHKCLKNIDLS